MLFTYKYCLQHHFCVQCSGKIQGHIPPHPRNDIGDHCIFYIAPKDPHLSLAVLDTSAEVVLETDRKEYSISACSCYMCVQEQVSQSTVGKVYAFSQKRLCCAVVTNKPNSLT